MINLNFPTVNKIVKLVSQDKRGRWLDQNGKDYIDAFTDIGASAITEHLLKSWIETGIKQGIAVRKPQIYYDDFRDHIYPLLIGKHLGLDEDVRLFYSNSGSEAVETAMKLARKATGRQIIYGIDGDFHGRTFGTLSLSVNGDKAPKYHSDGFRPLVPEILVWPKHMLVYNPAAVVISPINGNNTLEHWPERVWEFVQQVKANGGLVIFDEVQTGFGRAGGIVSIVEGQYKPPIKPDIWCFGKGTGAGWPFSLTVSRADLVDNTMTIGTHFNTMAGSPMGVFLSTKLIDELSNGMLDQATENVKYFEKELAPFVDVIRYGNMMALNHPAPQEFIERAIENGVLMMTARLDKPVRIYTFFNLAKIEMVELVARIRKSLTRGKYK